jgi:HNH endonuclease
MFACDGVKNKVCLSCEKTFYDVTKNKIMKFCSASCRTVYHAFSKGKPLASKLQVRCVVCNKLHKPYRNNNIYCSEKCQGRRDRNGRNRNIKNETYVCLYCEKTYTPLDSRRTSYCSKACSAKHRNFFKMKNFPSCHVAFTKCRMCDKLFQSRNKEMRPNKVKGRMTGNTIFCNEVCRDSYFDKLKKPKHIHACVDCNKSIFGTARKKRCTYCAKKQAKKKMIERGAERNRLKKHIDRAKYFGVEYEPICLTKVFERDNWVCQLCGIETPKELRGTYDDRAPELDHIVSMSNGGPHLYHNVHCACRWCNGRKGSRKDFDPVLWRELAQVDKELDQLLFESRMKRKVQ